MDMLRMQGWRSLDLRESVTVRVDSVTVYCVIMCGYKCYGLVSEGSLLFWVVESDTKLYVGL